MNRYFSIVLLFLILAVNACHNDTDIVPEWNKKGMYRVKEITGTNDRWGDFRMVFGYVNEKLDSIVCYDKKGKAVGRLNTSYTNNSVDFYWYDYVIRVDKDSVAKLHPDSIPYSAQLAAAWSFQLEDERIKEEVVSIYGKKNLPENAEFDYTYELKGEKKYLYEYGDDGRYLYLRVLNLHEPEVMPIKYEFLYEESLQSGYVEYVYGTDVWQPMRKIIYARNGGKVQSMDEFIFEEQWNLRNKQEFSYNAGNCISLKIGKDVIEYTYDLNNCLSALKRKDEEVKVVYENGAGNFSWLQMPELLLSARPFIE